MFQVACVLYFESCNLIVVLYKTTELTLACLYFFDTVAFSLLVLIVCISLDSLKIISQIYQSFASATHQVYQGIGGN